MTDDRFMQSRFWDWYVNNRPFTHEQESTLRQEALSVLVSSVNGGEILSLDGIATPLAIRIGAHHGTHDFEMNSNWICTAQDWACPCCSRSKFQISRTGKRGQILAKLVVHHDHMGEALEAAFHNAFEVAGTDVEQVQGRRLVESMRRAFAAYEEVLVCEDCNNADAEARKIAGSPQYFSFSIGQIGQFISAQDHEPHRIDASKVEDIWSQAQPAYDLRMQLIRSVAHAAATDAHWYEPYPRGTNAVATFGTRWESGDHAIQQWVSIDQLVKELGPTTPKPVPNLSRWRTVSHKVGRPLPANFLAILRSEEDRARAWDSIPDDWRCPICVRRKEEATYVGEQGKIGFYPKVTSGRGAWADARVICNHCESILMSLKLEVSRTLGSTPSDSYSFVSPAELAEVITPRAHSQHLVHGSRAAQLVERVTQRVSKIAARLSR